MIRLAPFRLLGASSLCYPVQSLPPGPVVNPDAQTGSFESETTFREMKLKEREFLIHLEMGWGMEEATSRSKNQSDGSL